jgi:hypothetical protein
MTIMSRADRTTSIPRADRATTIPRADRATPIPRADRTTSIPRADRTTSIPRADRTTTIPRADRTTTITRAGRTIFNPRGLLPTAGRPADRGVADGRGGLMRLTCMAVIAACCLFAPLSGLIWPQYNWDMLAYIGIVKSWHSADPTVIHNAAYADAQHFAASWALQKPYAQLIDPNSAYRHAMATDPQAFLAQFPFYRLRPLYLLLLDLLSHVTGSVAAATLLVSTAATLGLNALVATFALRRAGLVAATLLVPAFCLLPPVMMIARFETADALTTLLVAAACIAFLRGRDLLAAAMLCVCVMVRSDTMVLNAVLAFCLIAARVAGRWPRPVWQPAALLLASVGLARAIEAQAGSYGYRTLFHVTFMEGFTPTPAIYAHAAIPLRRVMTALVEGVSDGLANGGFSAVLLCGLAILALRPAATRDRVLAAALALTFLVRLAVFPSPDVRLVATIFAGLFVVVTELSARVIHEKPREDLLF